MRTILRHPPAALGLGAFVAALTLTLTALVAPAESAFPGGNGKIAFTRGIDVYTMNADGTGQTNRTNNPAGNADEPAWSPDGTKIAFERFTNADGDEIYTMNADGTGQARLTNDPAADGAPAWSADGTKIAFHSSRDGGGIYIMNADGTGQTRLTSFFGTDRDLAWSPDGTKIAFTRFGDARGGDVYTMNVDGTHLINSTNSPAPEREAAWSPDGKKIVFTTFSSGCIPCGFDDNDEIHTMNADSTGETILTTNPGNDSDPAWSPDGTKIAFVSDRGGNVEIYTMNADGTGQTRLTNTTLGASREPDWQPLVYPHPKNTGSIDVTLVPALRQTISAQQCAARGGTPSQHAAPLALTSCDPPTPVVGTSAYFGSEGVGSASIVSVPGNPSTVPDEADFAFSALLTDIRAGNPEGLDYGPNLRLLVKLRISDKLNCPPGCSGPSPKYYRPGTAVDFELSVPIDCSDTASFPAVGATCATNTTADAITPGAVMESQQTVVSVNRVRVNDAGLDNMSGNADDKLFAQQGTYIP